MSLTWTNGKDMEYLKLQVEKTGERIRDNAFDAMNEVVADAANDLQDKLEAAHTDTGEARERAGTGFPGRHRSGEMVGSISYDEKPRKSGKYFWSAWGWFNGEFQQYFKDQDLGEGSIPAAHALPDSYNTALQKFRAKMLDIVGRRK